MTHEHIWLAAALAAIWVIGTPGYLAISCWGTSDHIIKRGDFVAAPLIGWLLTWVFVWMVIIIGPIALLADGLEWVRAHVVPEEIRWPKLSVPQRVKDWLNAPALSCRAPSSSSERSERPSK